MSTAEAPGFEQVQGARAGCKHCFWGCTSKYMFPKDEYCIFILGLDNAGKITFLEQSKTWFQKNYKGMSLSKFTTTVGLNIGSVDMGKARLMFWNLSGQEELQSLWNKYCAECRGIIYVTESTDEERLSESKEAFEKVVSSEALYGIPILVLANQQNVETCLTIRDIKTTFSDSTCQIGQRVCLTQACSALTGQGHQMDGEVYHEEGSPATTAEGHHISTVNFTVLGLFIPGVGRVLPPGCVPPMLGAKHYSTFFTSIDVLFIVHR
ncbi:ADP-ribosylation factor-related protein 1 [Microtus ochrogaster]|uniref:ADP-ribosylation factor-related protein 1 n=1 Tax=Microtus ochrogaster TaxID=79684 RepID=A0A8J6L1R8_MICOH|nr:ADP-ribosylation factor-related protein 1 [Microtus ochrogaster]